MLANAVDSGQDASGGRVGLTLELDFHWVVHWEPTPSPPNSLPLFTQNAISIIKGTPVKNCQLYCQAQRSHLESSQEEVPLHMLVFIYFITYFKK